MPHSKTKNKKKKKLAERKSSATCNKSRKTSASSSSSSSSSVDKVSVVGASTQQLRVWKERLYGRLSFKEVSNNERTTILVVPAGLSEHGGDLYATAVAHRTRGGKVVSHDFLIDGCKGVQRGEAQLPATADYAWRPALASVAPQQPSTAPAAPAMAMSQASSSSIIISDPNSSCAVSHSAPSHSFTASPPLPSPVLDGDSPAPAELSAISFGAPPLKSRSAESSAEKCVVETGFALGEKLRDAISQTGPVPRLIKLTENGESWCIHAEGWWSLSALPPPISSAYSSSSSFSLSSPESSLFSSEFVRQFEWQWNLRPKERKSLGKDNFQGGTQDKFENRWSCSWGRLYDYGLNNNRTIETEVRKLSENAAALRLIEDVNTLMEKAGVPAANGRVNACYQNWYSFEENHSIAPHGDTLTELVEGMPIFSVSCGGDRLFNIEPEASSKDWAHARKDLVSQRCRLEISDGDLVIMGGECQTTHRHDVPKPRRDVDKERHDRINFTLRVFK